MSAQVLTRSQMRALLWHYRIAGEGQLPEQVVTAWWRELRGHTAAQIQTALASVPAQRVGRVSPAEVVQLVQLAALAPEADAGSARPPLPVAEPDRVRERARFAVAGQRGIRAVYEAMGWTRPPEAEEAGRVRCPYCWAHAGRVCRPITRTRDGRREDRDPVTRMHPSRLAAAH
ncbi:zinc finger domain-containing protein, partial [Actinosynnema sp.]|uniref:zinc finger domain-containing protein n=1 Tax=Actinosynnema sp. TaxID=1872144 RepID=UPI003F85656C